MTERVDAEAMFEEFDRKMRASAFNRRSFLKSAAFGVAMMAGAAGVADAGAQSGTPAVKGKPDAKQIFYNSFLQEDPKSFDWNADLYCNAEVEVFEGLLKFDANGTAQPGWAESFEANKDASVWTFHLRKDNKGWTNGDPVTADDFVWSFTRLLDPKTANSYSFILYDVKGGEDFNTKNGSPDALGLKAVDKWTFEMTLVGPRANLPQKVAYLACLPSHKASVEKYGAKWALGDVPLVSNGPFKLDKWTKGVNCTFSKNPNYYAADDIILTNFVDPIIPAKNQVNNFENGTGDQQLDWCTLGASDLTRYQNDPQKSKWLRQYVYPGIWMLLPSNGIPPFDKLEVRQALSHAIDRDRLVQVTNGLVTPAHCMVPQGVYGFFQDPAIDAIQNYDPKKAMDLLKGTPYEGGKNWPDITMIMRADEEQYNSNIMANDIVDQLRKNLGMTVKIQQIQQTNFNDTLFKNQAPLVWIRWWLDYPDPDNTYYDMFYGAKPKGQKRQAWENAEYDKVVVDAKGIQDPNARLEKYKEAEKIIQTDVGYIPVVYRLDMYAFKPWVKNVPVNKQGFTVPDGNIFVHAWTQIYIEGRPAGT